MCSGAWHEGLVDLGVERHGECARSGLRRAVQPLSDTTVTRHRRFVQTPGGVLARIRPTEPEDMGRSADHQEIDVPEVTWSRAHLDHVDLTMVGEPFTD